MSNKETVRTYTAQWIGKGKNPDNGCSLRQSTYGCNYVKGDNSFHVRWDEEDETIWAMLAVMLGLDQPAPDPGKVQDYWKSYAQQTRGDLTKAEQELADLKAAYSGLCKAHKELAEQVAELDYIKVFSAIRDNLYAYVSEQDYAYHAPIKPAMVDTFIHQAFTAATNRYSLQRSKKHHGQVPE